MKRIDFSFPSTSGLTAITGRLWMPDDQRPRAMVQLVHGMHEHVGRYDRLGEFLCQNGYALCGHDHLGHGGSLIDQTPGYFGGKDGVTYLLGDLDRLRRRLDRRFPGLPHFLLGHSMGSFVARLYLAQRGDGLAGAILSGTSGPNHAAALLGQPLADLLWLTGGETAVSRLANPLLQGGYCWVFKDSGSPHAWLSTDSEEVERYARDPQTQFLFTASAYHALYDMLCRASDRRWAHTLPKQLPVMLLSGDHDPVGQFGKGVRLVAQRLEAAGLADVTLQLYPGGRHEMLNEQNRDEVMDFLRGWLAERTPDNC